MTITYTVGNLMEANEVAIAHGCNTKGVMGAGVAKQVRARFPEAYEAYHKACDDRTFRVGSAQAVWAKDASHLIYNLGTQKWPGADATAWGIFLSFANMAEDAHCRGINTIAIPRIGAGIGGLEWHEVVPAIDEAIRRSNHRSLIINVYDLPEEPR